LKKEDKGEKEKEEGGREGGRKGGREGRLPYLSCHDVFKELVLGGVCEGRPAR
jgi:hypothetical protein